MLVGGRHREAGHDDDEHEQVVDRQALLDQPAGQVLGAELPAPHHPDEHAEDQAMPMYPADQTAASRMLTSCGLRLMATKSSAISTRIAATVAIQTHSATSTASLQRGPRADTDASG
jgi:hypothetical protein